MKIIIFTNDDTHFCAHLLPIALAAKGQNHDVVILTNISDKREAIESHGLSVIPILINRGSINLFSELFLLTKVLQILSKEKPDILHNFTIKPIVYGSIASLFCGVSRVINTFLGMGYIFISDKLSSKIIRKMICLLFSAIGKYKKMLFVVQNADDRQLLIDFGIASSSDVMNQCSVGVDTVNFPLLKEPKGKIIFALVARMLIGKGVLEFIEAAKILKNEGINAEFWLVGGEDQQNKSSIKKSVLQEHEKQNYIKYLDYQEDVGKIWEQSHVAVLPSYREGLSRALLEAGAYGRAIITTDAPGGRELIQDHVNGLLVRPRDSISLADAMRSLATNHVLRKKLAKQIRQDILSKYDFEVLADKMVDLYSL